MLLSAFVGLHHGDALFEVGLDSVEHRLVGIAITERLTVPVKNGYAFERNQKRNRTFGCVRFFREYLSHLLVLLLVRAHQRNGRVPLVEGAFCLPVFIRDGVESAEVRHVDAAGNDQMRYSHFSRRIEPFFSGIE